MKVKINQQDPTEPPTVELDGVDVARSLVGVTVVMEARNVPQVYLQTHAGVDLEVEGVVIQETAAASPGSAAELLAILEHLDPEIIQDKALAGLGMGDDSGAGTTRAIMEAIAGEIRSAYL